MESLSYKMPMTDQDIVAQCAAQMPANFDPAMAVPAFDDAWVDAVATHVAGLDPTTLQASLDAWAQGAPQPALARLYQQLYQRLSFATAMQKVT